MASQVLPGTLSYKKALCCRVLLRSLNGFPRGTSLLTWNFVHSSLPFILSTHTVTRDAVVFLYPGKGFPRDQSLSVPPKPFDSVVVVSSRNRTAVGRPPFYPFYNGMRPPSFPRANDSSRRYGGKGTSLTPFAPY